MPYNFMHYAAIFLKKKNNVLDAVTTWNEWNTFWLKILISALDKTQCCQLGCKNFPLRYWLFYKQITFDDVLLVYIFCDFKNSRLMQLGKTRGDGIILRMNNLELN